MGVLADEIEGVEPGGRRWAAEEGGRRGADSPGGVGGSDEEESGKRGGDGNDSAAEIERLRGRRRGDGEGGGGWGHGATAVRRRRPPSGGGGHLGLMGGWAVEKSTAWLAGLVPWQVAPLLHE